MSFGQTPQVTRDDPWEHMPEWVEEYYRSQIATSADSDARTATLREQYEGQNFVEDYAGQPGVDAATGAYDTAAAASAGFNRSAVEGLQAEAARTGQSIQQIMSDMGMNADQIAAISRDFGDAFDTSTQRGWLDNVNADGANISDLQARYESQNIDGMVDPVMSRMREDQARRMAELEASGAAVGGGGNTRMAVEMARTTDEGLRSRAQTEAELRERALRSGQELGIQEAGLRGSLADTSARLGLSQADQASRMLESSARFGLDQAGAQQGVYNDMLRGNEQTFGMAGAVAAAQQDASNAALQTGQMGMDLGAFMASEGERERVIRTEQLQQPMALENWFRGLTSTAPATALPDSGTRTTTGGGPGVGTQILGAGTSLLGAWLMSDERVKEDIAPLEGALDIIRRQRPSSYSYTNPDYDRVPIPGRRSAGLMAQDLEDIPGAVIEMEDGHKRVDPYPVLATIAAAVQELDRKVEAALHG